MEGVGGPGGALGVVLVPVNAATALIAAVEVPWRVSSKGALLRWNGSGTARRGVKVKPNAPELWFLVFST